jgi:hypothetical protein
MAYNGTLDNWILDRWAQLAQPSPPLPEISPYCMFCAVLTVDRCPCLRPCCRWQLCTSCAQRRFGHLGRWDFRENLLSCVLGARIRLARGERFGLPHRRALPPVTRGDPPSPGLPDDAIPSVTRGTGPPLSRSSSPSLPVGIPPLPVSPGPSFHQGDRPRSVGDERDPGRCDSPDRRRHCAFLVNWLFLDKNIR